MHQVKGLFILQILLVSVLSFGQESDIQKIPFSYDKTDFGKVESKLLTKITANNDGFPEDLPAHNCYFLEDKRPLPAFEKGARYFSPAYSFICFIPTKDASEKDFAAAYPNFNFAIERLSKYLKEKPKMLKQSYGDGAGIFDVPYNNSGWSFTAKAEILDYPKISGVVFLTQYTQEVMPNPVNNEELTYNFQGLTKDGKYYVCARFAVIHPSLPKGIDFTDERVREKAEKAEKGLDFQGSNFEKRRDILNERVSKYLSAEAKKVEKLPSDSFRPSLLNIKKLIASIE